MGESEGVLNDAATEKAVEAIVEQLASDEPVVLISSFNLYDILRLYDIGFVSVGNENAERWRQTFAIAVQTGGLLEVRRGKETLGFAVCWRTKNPHVSLKKEYPRPHENGNYAYVGWRWSKYGSLPWPKFREHLESTFEGIEFICWHDHRKKARKGRRGRLWVREVGK